MNTRFRGWKAAQKARCPDCGGFIDDSKRHQACPIPKCKRPIFIINGQIVDREPRPGTV